MASRLLITQRSECGRVVARLRYSTEWQEYSITTHLDGVLCNEATYFSSDRQDAEDTMLHMIQYAAQHLPQQLAII